MYSRNKRFILILFVFCLIIISLTSVLAENVDINQVRLNNGDGTYTSTFYAYPINYPAVDYTGETPILYYLPVNTSIISLNENSYKYGVKTGVYNVFFADIIKAENLSDKIIKIQIKDIINSDNNISIIDSSSLYIQPVSMNYYDGNNTEEISLVGNASASIEGNLINYTNAYTLGSNVVDLQFIYHNDFLKENIILKNKNFNIPTLNGTVNLEFKNNIYYSVDDFDIYADPDHDGKLTLQTSDFIDGEIEFRRVTDGRIIYRLPKVSIIDNNGAETTGHYRVIFNDGYIELNVQTDWNWLNDGARAFPIMIDPTTTIDATVGRSLITDDSYVGYESPNYVFGDETSFALRTNYSTGTIYRGFLAIDFSDLEIKNVTTANITLSQFASSGSGNNNFTLSYCNTSFSEHVLTWNNQDTYITNCNTPFYKNLSTNMPNNFYTFNLTSFFNTEITDNKKFTLQFKYDPEADTSNHYQYFYSKEYATESQRPVISLTYTTTDKLIDFTDYAVGNNYNGIVKNTGGLLVTVYRKYLAPRVRIYSAYKNSTDTTWTVSVNPIDDRSGYNQDGTPDVAINSLNEMYYVSYGRSSTYTTYYQAYFQKSTDNGTNWGTSYDLSGGGSVYYSNPQIDIDGSNNVHIIYSRETATQGIEYRFCNRTATTCSTNAHFSTAITLLSGSYLTYNELKVNNQSIFVIGSTSSDGNLTLFKCDYATVNCTNVSNWNRYNLTTQLGGVKMAYLYSVVPSRNSSDLFIIGADSGTSSYKFIKFNGTNATLMNLPLPLNIGYIDFYGMSLAEDENKVLHLVMSGRDYGNSSTVYSFLYLNSSDYGQTWTSYKYIRTLKNVINRWYPSFRSSYYNQNGNPLDFVYYSDTPMYLGYETLNTTYLDPTSCSENSTHIICEGIFNDIRSIVTNKSILIKNAYFGYITTDTAIILNSTSGSVDVINSTLLGNGYSTNYNGSIKIYANNSINIYNSTLDAHSIDNGNAHLGQLQLISYNGDVIINKSNLINYGGAGLGGTSGYNGSSTLFNVSSSGNIIIDTSNISSNGGTGGAISLNTYAGTGGNVSYYFKSNNLTIFNSNITSLSGDGGYNNYGTPSLSGYAGSNLYNMNITNNINFTNLIWQGYVKTSPDGYCGSQAVGGNLNFISYFNNFYLTNSNLNISAGKGTYSGNSGCSPYAGYGGNTYFNMTGNNFIVTNTNLTMNAGDGGNAGYGSTSGVGGNGGYVNIYYNLANLTLSNSILNFNNGKGGSLGGDNGGAGGQTLGKINTTSNFYISNSNLNMYGGNGGNTSYAGSGSGRRGGAGGYLNDFKIYSSNMTLSNSIFNVYEGQIGQSTTLSSKSYDGIPTGSHKINLYLGTFNMYYSTFDFSGADWTTRDTKTLYYTQNGIYGKTAMYVELSNNMLFSNSKFYAQSNYLNWNVNNRSEDNYKFLNITNPSANNLYFYNVSWTKGFSTAPLEFQTTCSNSGGINIYSDGSGSILMNNIFGDASVNQVGASNNYGTSSQVFVTNQSSNQQWGYWWFNFTNKATPSYKNTKLYLYDSYSTSSTEQEMNWTACNDTFNESTLTWNNKGTEVINCGTTFKTTQDEELPVGYFNLDIQNIVRSYNLFTIYGNPKLGNDFYADFGSKEVDWQKQPYVNYTVYAPIKTFTGCGTVTNKDMVTWNTPANENINNTVTFNYTIDLNTATSTNCSINLLNNNTGYTFSINNNGITDLQTVVNYNNLSRGSWTYVMNCLTNNDEKGYYSGYLTLNKSSTSNINTTISSPANGTNMYPTYPYNYQFTVSGNESNYICTFYMDNVSQQTISTTNNTLTTISYTLPINKSIGAHYWYVDCEGKDLYNISETRYVNAIYDSINITPTGDVYTDQISYPNTNLATEQYLRAQMRSGRAQRTYIRFNVSSANFTGTVMSSNLYLYLDAGVSNLAGEYTDAYYCNTDFNVTNITWNNQDTWVNTSICNLSSSSLMTSYPSAYVWENFTINGTQIQNDVDKIFTVKLMIRDEQSGSTYYYHIWDSLDFAGTTYDPYMQIQYIPSLPVSTTTIPYVSAPASANPTELGNTTIYVQFNATDSVNYTNINVTSASIKLEKVGQTTINSSSCSNTTDGVNTISFNCTLKLPYYAGSGAWTVNASISDNFPAQVINATQSFTYGTLSAIQVNVNAISFGNFTLNTMDKPANSSTILTNTGNQPFTNVTITGQPLLGQSNGAYQINSTQFESCVTNVSNTGTSLQDGVIKQIIGATLPVSGTQTLYYFGDFPVSLGIIAQQYKTNAQWLIQVYS